MRSESCERLNAAEVLVRPSLLIRAKSMSTLTGSRCCDVAGAALGLFPLLPAVSFGHHFSHNCVIDIRLAHQRGPSLAYFSRSMWRLVLA